MTRLLEDTSEPSFISPIATLIWEVFIAFIISYLITLYYSKYKIDGYSMEPTLRHKDAIIINKFIYYFKKPQYGDIIVFPYQKDPSKKYIKRIIGLPGEVIDIKEGAIYINGHPLQEPYITKSWKTKGNITYPFTIPKNHYFVLGDNRDHSSDSRFYDVGTIEKSKIFGKAWIRIWPLKSIRKL